MEFLYKEEHPFLKKSPIDENPLIQQLPYTILSISFVHPRIFIARFIL